MSAKDQQSDEVITLMNRFVGLANEMKNEGSEGQIVSTALMVATGVYATYLAAGNEGYLKPDGVDKIAAAFKHNLSHLQEIKKQQFNPEGKD